MFREEKATALAYWLVSKAGGTMSHKKLMKLLYLYEREYMRVVGLIFTGDHFASMPEGPVLQDTYDCMKRYPTPQMKPNIGETWKQSLTAISKFKPISIKAELKPDAVLTPKQIAILADIWTQYGSMSEEELIALTHKFPEWRKPTGESNKADLDILDVFKSFGLNEDESMDRVRRIRDREKVDTFFDSVA